MEHSVISHSPGKLGFFTNINTMQLSQFQHYLILPTKHIDLLGFIGLQCAFTGGNARVSDYAIIAKQSSMWP
jgi:hypothetical protein